MDDVEHVFAYSSMNDGAISDGQYLENEGVVELDPNSYQADRINNKVTNEYEPFLKTQEHVVDLYNDLNFNGKRIKLSEGGYKIGDLIKKFEAMKKPIN